MVKRSFGARYFMSHFITSIVLTRRFDIFLHYLKHVQAHSRFHCHLYRGYTEVRFRAWTCLRVPSFTRAQTVCLSMWQRCSSADSRHTERARESLPLSCSDRSTRLMRSRGCWCFLGVNLKGYELALNFIEI